MCLALLPWVLFAAGVVALLTVPSIARRRRRRSGVTSTLDERSQP
jgi:hypothetical protein